MNTSHPVWRSLLYVPANNPRFIAKAHLRGADGIILDLEDSVPNSELEYARKELRSSAVSASSTILPLAALPRLSSLLIHERSLFFGAFGPLRKNNFGKND